MLNQNVGGQSTRWLSYHIYYFQDLDLAIQRLVRPLIFKLLAAGLIERFFFIRYHLGGPHIRLRLLVTEDRTDTVAAVAEAEAKSFFSSCPSGSSLGVDEIRQNNKVILASDPNEWDDSVYPDNSFLATPFRPEIERYGGPVFLEASLDFFAVSSVAALELLNRYGESSHSRLLAVASQALACQALSFAHDVEDLMPLLRYGVDTWGESKPRAVAKAERIFSEQRDNFSQLFQRELWRLSSPPAALSGDPEEVWAILGEATRRLSRQIRTADQATHQRIGCSQLHMTANRLGLSNAEEAYISRSLSLAAAEILWKEIERPDELYQTCESRENEVEIKTALSDLVLYALARFTSLHRGEQ